MRFRSGRVPFFACLRQLTKIPRTVFLSFLHQKTIFCLTDSLLAEPLVEGLCLLFISGLAEKGKHVLLVRLDTRLVERIDP